MKVVKLGGSLLEDPGHRRGFLQDVAALSKKAKVVLVHGGGKEITRALDQRGIKAPFVNGLRVTDEATRRPASPSASGTSTTTSPAASTPGAAIEPGAIERAPRPAIASSR